MGDCPDFFSAALIISLLSSSLTQMRGETVSICGVTDTDHYSTAGCCVTVADDDTFISITLYLDFYSTKPAGRRFRGFDYSPLDSETRNLENIAINSFTTYMYLSKEGY